MTKKLISIIFILGMLYFFGCASEEATVEPVCGDSVVDINETCDDGNAVDDGNGCNSTCKRNDSCGDNITQNLYETCDDGNVIDDGNGCDASCQANNTCGNGIIEAAVENCDDNNTIDGDGCDSTCNMESGVQQIETMGLLSLNMRYVPGGLTTPTGTDDNGTATVSNGYLMGETEVTYELWYAVYTWATHAEIGRAHV